MRPRPVSLGCVVIAAALGAAPAPATPPPGAPSCEVFPADNVWHSDVSALPVHARSAAWIASMGGPDRRLHPDFGPSGEAQPYGIPYDVVAGSHQRVSVDFYYPDESDPGPYPFGPDITIEGGSDRHAIMIDRDSCVLYELFDATYSASGSTAGSGATWNLGSNALRPAGWTSADAAGLPIFAGLLRRDEVAAGAVDHATRLTASQTDRSYVWPARHQAGARSDPSLPPMGARFRLKASFDTSGFRADARAILAAMKRHGLLLADNGSNWYFGGASEDGWDTDMLDELKSIPAGAFEAVDASSLMVDPNSGRVSQVPGVVLGGAITAAFQTARSFVVTWRATGAGVVSVDVRYRRAPWGGSFGGYGMWRSATTGGSGLFSGSPGYTYCLSARGRDAGGNVSGWGAERCTALPLDDAALVHAGSWARPTGSAYYEGTASRSTARGASLSRTGAVVRRIALLATRCPGCGSVDVLLAGVLLRRVSLEAATTQRRALIGVYTFGSPRIGTVTVRVATSGRPAEVDALGLSRA